jgi:hypothetical protein
VISLAYEMCGLDFKVVEVKQWFDFDLDLAAQYISEIKESGALTNGTN